MSDIFNFFAVFIKVSKNHTKTYYENKTNVYRTAAGA